MVGILRLRLFSGSRAPDNTRRPSTRTRLSYYRDEIQTYRSVMIGLGVIFIGHVFTILLFSDFFPTHHCYLSRHGEVPVSSIAHCGWKSTTNANMERLFEAVTRMLGFMEVPYFLNGDLLLAAWSYLALEKPDMHEATIGILPAGLEKLQGKVHNLPPRYHLTVYRSKLHDPGNRDSSIVARVIDRSSDLYVDIHEFTPMFHSDGVTPYLRSIWSQSWHRCQSCEIRSMDDRRQFYIPLDWVLPLRDCQYHGINATCPAKPLQLLHYYYHIPLYNVDLDQDSVKYTAIE